MIEKTLINIGMTERQAKLYITGLKIGAASASDISTKARENRVTTYKTLQEMAILGYTKEFKKNKKTHFAMINPDEILEQQEKKTKILKESMPELVGLMKTFGERPKIQIYEGIEGLKTVFRGFLESEEDFRVLIGSNEMDPFFKSLVEKEFTPLRLQKKNKTRAIVSEKNIDRINYYRQHHQCVSINNELFNSSLSQIGIYDYTKVAICNYETGNLNAFVIDSKTFHDCIAGMFDVMFETLSTRLPSIASLTHK